MVQLSSVSDHKVKAAGMGWGSANCFGKGNQVETHQPQGKLRSNLHKVRERERLLPLS